VETAGRHVHDVSAYRELPPATAQAQTLCRSTAMMALCMGARWACANAIMPSHLDKHRWTDVPVLSRPRMTYDQEDRPSISPRKISARMTRRAKRITRSRATAGHVGGDKANTVPPVQNKRAATPKHADQGTSTEGEGSSSYRLPRPAACCLLHIATVHVHAHMCMQLSRPPILFGETPLRASASGC
jgi:hypothetical protein